MKKSNLGRKAAMKDMECIMKFAEFERRLRVLEEDHRRRIQASAGLREFV